MNATNTDEIKEKTQARINALMVIFSERHPEIKALWDWRYPGVLYIVFSNARGGILLRFQDMPRIAAVLGTERLDFGSFAGTHYGDSITFEGSVLEIVARYELR